jgi:3-hydroxybutyrate dehydrogenase
MLNSHQEAAETGDLCAAIAARTGVRVRFGRADMSRAAEVADLIAAATQGLGQVDVLVNNAGIQYTAPIHEFPPERWDAIVAINLSAVFHATRAVLPQMLARGWGRIINVASVHGLVASADKAAYVAAKHGVVGLTKVVALETAETGITCNAICPGWVLTPLVAQQIEARARDEHLPHDQAKRELLEEKQPSKEFVTVEQLGALAVFLCTPAADQIRGQAIAMDGGWTAQ